MSNGNINVTGSNAIGAANVILGLLNLRQRGRRLKHVGEMEERQDAREQREHLIRYGRKVKGTGGVQREIPGTVQQQARINQIASNLAVARDKREEQSYTNQWQKWFTDDVKPSRMLMLAKNEKWLEPAVNHIMEGLQTGDIKSREDAYRVLKQRETVFLKQQREDVQKEVMSLIKQGKENEADAKAEFLKQLKPGFLEDFFGFPGAYKTSRPGANLAFPETSRAGTQPTTYGDEPIEDENGLLYILDSRGKRNYLPNQVTPKQKIDLAADAEEFILANPENEAVNGYIDQFNQFSRKPYVYIWADIAKEWWPDSEGAQRVDLPMIDGERVEAQDIWHTATQNNETIEQVLERINAIRAKEKK
jgi:hypothetical protein